jgi:hypothetical protein
MDLVVQLQIWEYEFHVFSPVFQMFEKMVEFQKNQGLVFAIIFKTPKTCVFACTYSVLFAHIHVLSVWCSF